MTEYNIPQSALNEISSRFISEMTRDLEEVHVPMYIADIDLYNSFDEFIYDNFEFENTLYQTLIDVAMKVLDVDEDTAYDILFEPPRGVESIGDKIIGSSRLDEIGNEIAARYSY